MFKIVTAIFSSNRRNKILRCYDRWKKLVFFDQPVKNDLGKYDVIQKIATGQGDDYTPGSLLDFPYFKKY